MQQKQAEAEREKLAHQSNNKLNQLAEGFFGTGEQVPDNVIAEMSKYMDRVEPNAKLTVGEYVEDAFYHAVGKLGLTRESKSKQQRTEKNRSDASSRLSSSSRAPSEDNLREDRSKPLDRRAAIAAAVAQLEKE